MSDVKIEKLGLGPFLVNCYVLFNEKTKNAIIIDAPQDIQEALSFIKKKKLTPLCIIITHGHFDHIQGLNDVLLPFYIHPEDAPFLGDANLNISSFLGAPITIKRSPLILMEGELTIEDFTFKVFHTPGHSPGSVSLSIDTMVLCGDTLFFDSVGRTDFPGASHEVLIQAIKEKILPLGDAVHVFPGHGPQTTIAREKQNNPFLAP